MLTKKQLEDAAKCKGNEACMTCRAWNVVTHTRYIEYDGMSDCIEKLAQTALAYREMLEEVIKHLSHCPFCKINRPWLYKHKDGCELAALLKEGDEQDG